MTVFSMKTSFIKCNETFLLEECWAKKVVKSISALSLPSPTLPLLGQEYHQVFGSIECQGRVLHFALPRDATQHSSKSKHLSSPTDKPPALDDTQRKSY